MGSSPTFVTVVSGVPRSGTSMLMQMLRAGGFPVLTDGFREPDSHNPRGYLEFEPARRLRRDTSWVGAAEGRAVKVVHALVRCLPAGHDYRVILIRRDLGEVVASQQAMLADVSALDGGLSPQRLAEIFEAQLRELEECLEAQPRFRVLGVGHAEALAQPRRVAEELSRFLGGGLDVEAMAAAVDPALHRQRAPPG
jgi:hypothetical protein